MRGEKKKYWMNNWVQKWNPDAECSCWIIFGIFWWRQHQPIYKKIYTVLYKMAFYTFMQSVICTFLLFAVDGVDPDVILLKRKKITFSFWLAESSVWLKFIYLFSILYLFQDTRCTNVPLHQSASEKWLSFEKRCRPLIATHSPLNVWLHSEKMALKVPRLTFAGAARRERHSS